MTGGFGGNFGGNWAQELVLNGGKDSIKRATTRQVAPPIQILEITPITLDVFLRPILQQSKSWHLRSVPILQQLLEHRNIKVGLYKYETVTKNLKTELVQNMRKAMICAATNTVRMYNVLNMSPVLELGQLVSVNMRTISNKELRIGAVLHTLKHGDIDFTVQAITNPSHTLSRIFSAGKRPTLERTRTSIDGDYVESLLNRKLSELALELAGTDPKTLSHENKQSIINIINGLVQKAYFTGQDYADRVKGEVKPIDRYDFEMVTNLTKQAVIRFFDLFEPDLLAKFRMAQNMTAPILAPNLGLRRTDFENPDTSKNKLDIKQRKTLGFTNKEVKKLKLKNRERAKRIYDLTDVEIDELERQQDLINGITTSIVLLSSITAIQSLNQGTLSNATRQVEFVTRRDDRVCPICEALDGNRYNVDPTTHIIDGPLIPDETHINCRCRYLLVSDDDGELLIG